jgi:hypothetical protein
MEEEGIALVERVNFATGRDLDLRVGENELSDTLFVRKQCEAEKTREQGKEGNIKGSQYDENEQREGTKRTLSRV